MRRLAVTAGIAAALITSRVCADTKTECIDASEDAQRLRDDGKLRLARQNLLVCVRDACPEPVREECNNWLSALERDTPTLIFAAQDPAGHDTTAVTVSFDGQVVADSLNGRPIMVDPGQHTLRFVMQGAAPIEETVVVRVGEKNRVVSVDFQSNPMLESPGSPVVEQPSEKEGPSLVGPMVLGGLGLVSLGAFGYFGWAGKSEIDDLRATCGTTQSCKAEDVDAADRKLLVGDIFLGVGVVSLGVATYLLLSDGSTTPPQTAGLDVRSTRGGFVAGYGHRF